MNTREIVLDYLIELERSGEYSHRLMRMVLDKYDYLTQQEKAFIKRLGEGSVEKRLELDYVLNQFSGIPVRKMKPLIRSLLRMSAYQLLFMDSVPDRAVCDEAVKLAAKRGFGSLKGFVNAVLRNLARGREQITYPDREKSLTAALSVHYSMPEQLVDMWLAEYGPERTEILLGGLEKVHPVTVRFRSSLDKSACREYLSQMEHQGVHITPAAWLTDSYCLEHTDALGMLPGYEEGAFAVQDISSQLAVAAAGVRSGDLVVDVCAAPGGKSLLAAEKASRVIARDVSARKLLTLQENADRLHAENVTVQEWDGTVTDESLEGKADIVFLDVPCSGLGVIGKKRDIKYRVNEDTFRELCLLQQKLIRASWRYVRPGGVLLYSTCTIRRQENQEMCDWICKNFPFVPESMAGYLPEELKSRADQGWIQLLPGEDPCDGFFFARLVRKDG